MKTCTECADLRAQLAQERADHLEDNRSRAKAIGDLFALRAKLSALVAEWRKEAGEYDALYPDPRYHGRTEPPAEHTRHPDARRISRCADQLAALIEPAQMTKALLRHPFTPGLSTCPAGLHPTEQCHAIVGFAHGSPNVECSQPRAAHESEGK